MARSLGLASSSPFRERQFQLLFTGRLISIVGSAVAPIGLAFAVLDMTGSATDLGIVLAAGAIAQVLFLVVGGIWADRLPRHLILVATNVVMGAAQLAAAVLLLADRAELWHLVALNGVRGAALAFFFPAQQGLVPQVVRPEQLQSANATLHLTISLTNVVGAALGGIVVAATSPAVALAFDGGTYLASATVLALIRLAPAARAEVRNFLVELREGWDEFRSRSWLWVTVTQHGLQNAFVFSTFSVLGPLVADRALNGPTSWGAILAAQSAGVVGGGALAMRYRPERPLVAGALVFFSNVPVFVLLALSEQTALIAAAAAIAGVGLAISGVLWETTVQQQVPQEKLSRVVSYDALTSYAAIPVGMAIVGPIATRVGVATTFFAAAVILTGTLLAMLAPRSVRELRTQKAAGGATVVAGAA